eukprot:TRINITY_DN816_c0_g1_i3.p1 TRINITY_DN816_c0_g1~~TRINITY_DN816_c0_g1_i3.p1  ORF type:complete len:315 (-),score=64.99 TRINITY_DN816_c0_g1_i3:165-1109(-)
MQGEMSSPPPFNPPQLHPPPFKIVIRDIDEKEQSDTIYRGDEQGEEEKTFSGNEVTFGSKVSFRVKSGTSDYYMIAHHGAKDLNGNCAEIIEESTFTILRFDDITNTGGLVRSGETVLIQTSDGCYVAVEADGQVNSNRSGPPGTFMKWKLHTLTQGEKTMCNGSVVAFESVMHKYLSAEKGGGASAKTKRRRHASKWQVELISLSNRVIKTSIEKRSGVDLWNILAKNYHLAALKIRETQIQQHHNKVQRRVNELEKRKASEEEKVCTVCWENPPNTVILECGHICVCDDCGDALGECPVCRGTVTRVIQIRR